MSYSIFSSTMVDMAWPEIEKAVQNGAIVLLPTGVIEEHGPHMTLGVDTYLSYQACSNIKCQLDSFGIKALITPPFYWGMNNATGSFPGSFTVRKETMKALLYDILLSLKRWGVTYVFNINWHDDFQHCNALLEAIKEARIETGIRAYSVISDILGKRLGLTGKESHVLLYNFPFPEGTPPKYLDIHAGSGETGIMAHYFPKLVDKDVARTLTPTNLTMEEFAIWRLGWYDALKLTPSGYLGNPADFNIEEGKVYMETLSKVVAALIKDFLDAV